MKDHNWENSAELKQKAALLTRSRKDEPDRAELYQHWQERFASLELAESVEGISRSRLSAAKAEALEATRGDQQAAADWATAHAIAHLEERHVTFSPQKLMEQAFAMSPGLTGFAEIMHSCEALRCSGRLVDGKTARGDPLLTTDHAIRTESDIISRLDTSAGQGKSLIKPETVDIHLQDTVLNHGQQQAINLVLESSEDRIVGIQGTAGSGKTRMLGEMRSIAEDNGIQVLGLAPTASAARTLEAESDIPPGHPAIISFQASGYCGRDGNAGSPWRNDQSCVIRFWSLMKPHLSGLCRCVILSASLSGWTCRGWHWWVTAAAQWG